MLSALEAKFDKDAAIAKLDADGFNTPKNIDDARISPSWRRKRLLERKRCVLMSSIENARTRCRFRSQHVRLLSAKRPRPRSSRCGVEWLCLHGGAARQLLVAPTTTTSLGTLFQLDKENPQDVELAVGDTLLGDTLRSTLAEVIAQTLEAGTCLNTDFAVVNVDGTPPSVEALRERLTALA